MPDSAYRRLGDWELSPILRTPIEVKGGTYEIKQEGIIDLQTVQEVTGTKGTQCSFVVQFKNDPVRAARFKAYCVANASNADIQLFDKDAGWYYRVWGVAAEKTDPDIQRGLGWVIDRYMVACILYSPYTYAVVPVAWAGSSISLPQSKVIVNEGHYDDPLDSLEITCKYDGGHVKTLTLANTAGDSIVITDEALTDMVILIEKGTLIYETYEDTFTSGTKHGNDTSGDGTFDTDHIELDDTEECIYHLAGPHFAHLPVILTLTATLDSGGATGEAYIEVSGDGSSYYEAFDQSDFNGLGQVKLSLQDAAYLKDIYVKFRCASGTSGKKLNLSYLKFYVQRRIEDGEMPLIEAGKSSTLTLSCNETYGDQIDLDAKFRSRRLLS